MRRNTKVAFGVRWVGDSKMADEVGSNEVYEVVKRFTRVLAESMLAQRIEFVVARTEDEIRERFSGGKRGQSMVENMEELSEMFDQIEQELSLKES